MENDHITQPEVKKSKRWFLFLLPFIVGFITYSIFTFLCYDKDGPFMLGMFATALTFFILCFKFIIKHGTVSKDPNFLQDHLRKTQWLDDSFDRNWRTDVGSLKNPLGLYRSGSPNNVYGHRR